MWRRSLSGILLNLHRLNRVRRELKKIHVKLHALLTGIFSTWLILGRIRPALATRRLSEISTSQHLKFAR